MGLSVCSVLTFYLSAFAADFVVSVFGSADLFSSDLSAGFFDSAVSFDLVFSDLCCSLSFSSIVVSYAAFFVSAIFLTTRYSPWHPDTQLVVLTLFDKRRSLFCIDAFAPRHYLGCNTLKRYCLS